MKKQSSHQHLLLEGIAAARAGDQEEAQKLLRRVTELEPDNAEAWIWRASVVENSADKKSYLEEALRFEPDNLEAKLALERVTKLEGDISARVGNEEEVLYCEVHPERETMLRCNRCGRLMCTDCAVRHPVGLRCRECVNNTRSPIYQVDANTALKTLLATLVVATPITLLVFIFGDLVVSFGIFGWIIGFMIGGAIGRAMGSLVQRLVPRKRGTRIQQAVGVGIVLSSLLAGAGLLLIFGSLPNLILILIYFISAIPAAVASLK